MTDLPSGFISIDTIIRNKGPEAVRVLISYSKYFASHRISEKNVGIFIKLISTNIPEVVDSLLVDRKPSSFFSMVIPNRNFIVSILEILSSHKPTKLYYKTILLCLGGINLAYSSPQQGINLYKLSVADIHHIAKFLIIDNEEVERSILDILDKLKILPSKYDISSLSAKIIDTYFDSNKNLDSVIPGVLLN